MSDISIKSVIKEAWSLFKDNFWGNVGIMFATFVLSMFLSFANQMLAFFATAFLQSYDSVTAMLVVVVSLWAFVSVVIVGAINLMIKVFYIEWALNVSNKKDSPAKSAIRRLLDLRYLLGFLLAMFFQGILIALSALLVVPLFFVLPRLTLVTYRFADKYKNAGEAWRAVKDSWNMTKGHTLTIWGLILILIAMNFAGMILFMLGMLISVPISLFALAKFYKNLNAQVQTKES